MPLKLIQRSEGGAWYIRGTVAGRYVYRSTQTSSKRAAEAIRIRTEAEMLERHSLGRKATATFQEAAVNYLTAGGEGRFLTPILHHFKDVKLSAIDNAAINEAAASLYPGAKPSTINRQLITPVSAVLTMAAEDGLCEPVKLRRRKVTDKKTRWLTPAEFTAFAAELPPHLKQIIGFMIGTGARARETLSLQVSTLYLSTGQALLAETKNGLPRMVEIPDAALPLIRARKLPKEGTAFLTSRNRPYELRDNTGGQFKTAFNKARARVTENKENGITLGRDVTPHTIRHTWATWYYAQTRDFGRLLDLGGWADADTANIYRKIAPDDLAQDLLQHGWDFRRGFQRDGAPALRVVSSN